MENKYTITIAVTDGEDTFIDHILYGDRYKIDLDLKYISHTLDDLDKKLLEYKKKTRI